MRETAESAGRVPTQDVAGDGGPSKQHEDRREVYRIMMDVLATPEQVVPLVVLLETAVCGQPDDHLGPCRLAWRISTTGPDEEVPVPPADLDRIRRTLSALEVLPPHQATAELLAEAGYAPDVLAGPGVPGAHDGEWSATGAHGDPP